MKKIIILLIIHQLAAAATLTGIVHQKSGSAIAGCDVVLKGENESTQTDNQGQFTFAQLNLIQKLKLDWIRSENGKLIFTLKKRSNLNLELYSLKGIRISSYLLKNKEQGNHEVSFAAIFAEELKSGLFFLKVNLDGVNHLIKTNVFENEITIGNTYSTLNNSGLGKYASLPYPDTLNIYCQGYVAKQVVLNSFDQDLGVLEVPQSPNIVIAIADDASLHMSAYKNNDFLNTPNFDRIADEGILFNHAYVPNPKCSPARAALLTGRYSWQIAEAANHFGNFPGTWTVYPKVLADNGWHVGYGRKGWAPGRWQGSYWANPAGETRENNFTTFFNNRPANQPFYYWFGSQDPHRGYPWQSGVSNGKQLVDAKIPGYYPDVDSIRHDILDYAIEVERFDSDVGSIIQTLENAGVLENTIIVVTSDHGYPFPRGKGQLYDEGIHVPMSIRWGNEVPGKRVVDDFINWIDLSPTFLELAGIKPLATFSGRSLVPLLLSDQAGQIDPMRNHVFAGKERHDNRRVDPLTNKQEVGYPIRVLKNAKYLYIKNFKPDRWPAGDPPCYNNIDRSPTKSFLINHKDEPTYSRYFDMAMGKRPGEELYDMIADPYSLNNLARDPNYQTIKDSLWSALETHLTAQGDPRIIANGDVFDDYPHFINTNTCFD